MKRSRISSCRPAGALTALVVALVVETNLLFAQESTGKIEGRVRDQAGNPIASAQVFIVGTAFNAMTNAQGYYFINNVPAGSVALRAAFIGHRPVQVENARVLAGQTITVDVQLPQTAIQIEEITVVTQAQPLVPRDEVTTKQRVVGSFASDLPVDRVEDVLALMPGVVADNDGNISVRGGRENETAIYVDGVPIQAGYRGDRFVGSLGSQLSFAAGMFEEASVTTGATSAEFGNAKSGVVSIVTKTGTHSYQGSISYETDEVFGVNHGIGLNRLEGSFGGPLFERLTFNVSGALTGRRSAEDGFDSQNAPVFLKAGVDTTIRQLSILDDPETDFDERLTADTAVVDIYNFAISRGECDEFAGAGTAGLASSDSFNARAVQEIRNNYGLSCNGVRLPGTARTLHSLTSKLNYTYGTGSQIALTLATSRDHGHVVPFIVSYVNNLSTGLMRGSSNRNRLATLNWTQNLSKSREHALALDVALSYQQDRTINSPLTIESDLSTRNPFAGFILKPLDFEYDFDNFPLNQALIDNVRRNTGRITPIDVNNGTAYAATDVIRDNAYGLYGNYQNFAVTMDGATWGMAEAGRFTVDNNFPARLSLYKEDRYIGRATLDWQLDRYNRIKLGGEFTRYAIDNYSFGLTDKFFSEAYIEKPIRWNLFAEDRLDLGDMVVVGGLRYDWYDTRASRPYATDTAGNTYPFPRVSTMPGFDPANPTALFVRDRSHGYLSPHVQVSFPVTDRTNFRLSYSHQVQAPDFGLLLGGINTDLGNTNTNHVFGSDLDFGKTIAFEFGIRHAFSDDMVLDAAAYNKDVISDPAARLVSLYDPVTQRDTDFRILTNLDFGNVRGLDVRLDRRFGSFFNGTIAYAYQTAKNTGSDPFTYVNYGSRIVNQVGGTGGAQPPPQAILPTDDSRPHALTGAFAVTFPHDFRQGTALGSILGNVGVFSTFRYTSGTAYTRCGSSNEDQSVLSIEGCVRLFPEGINTQRLPAFKELNARFTKGFGLGTLDLTGYLDIRNVLSFRNILQVFAVNGDVRNDAERAANLQADLDDLATERDVNGAVGVDGAIELPTAHEECAGWISSRNLPAAANCIYLIRAEQRFGDGDHVFTLEEQSNAINALYELARGEHQHIGPGRRARIGVEIDF